MDAIASPGSVGGTAGPVAAPVARPASGTGEALDVNTAALKLIQAAIVGSGSVLDVRV